ncbi:phosphatidate cytidylyltransferase [Schlesneria paludicola]|uniref:phosphatidate cytidylyltransferase n=1 Tax=Schlesneria paludicola TaxID=360056 RepID=UPI00029AEB29|nr:phosphatidate cytidylyltransferase [Schlesneria paludicola]
MSRLSTSQNFIQPAIPVNSAGAGAPPLPQWVLALPGVPHLVSRLGVTEFRRRLFHMTPALLPVGLPIIPHSDVWGPTLVTIIFILSISALVLAVTFGHLMKRRREENWMEAVVGYMVPVLLPLVIFPGRAEFGLMTLQIIALGDGSATLGGIMLGGRRLPWNRSKTFSGLFCFAIVGTLASTYSFWGESRPAIPVGSAFLICGTAALLAAFVESLPIRSNDNLRVGVTALFTGVLMSQLLSSF